MFGEKLKTGKWILEIGNKTQMIKMKRTILLIVFLIGFTFSTQAQFLKASGKKIVDDNNNEVLLRGMGLGGWMVQEGYMLETASFANTEHDIRVRIQSLIGADNTNAFYDAWLANHCTRKDIDSMARWGFNSVRLPMHYNLFTLPIQSEPVAGQNTWLDKGFIMVDSLVKWCSANKMYVILDLHAAPGGQGHDAAISDYDSSLPSLWESTDNQNKTIALWKKLAERYANEPWVGGYDLINEPNWNFTAGANANGCSETTNSQLWQLYKSITAAIRTVDTKHLIFVEGNCWANNYSGFYTWDNNMSASYHKYWSYNDMANVQGLLNTRNNFNIPLWLGESGENSNQWFKDCITLLENNDIGWSWWPEKKINNIVGPLTVKEDAGYRTLLNYWQSGGTKPTADFATQALMNQANNLKIENNIYHKDIIDAMFRQIGNNVTIPFAKNNIPGKINCTDFDLGGEGYAYHDTDVADYHVSTNVTTSWNQGNAYRNDGVDIEVAQDTSKLSNGYDVNWIADGEWMQYTSQVDSTAGYNISLHYFATTSITKLKITVDDHIVAPSTTLPATNGKWGNYQFQNIVLPKGTHKIKIIIDKGGMKLGFATFFLSTKIEDILFNAIAGETASTSQTIFLDFNKAVDSNTFVADNLICKVNGTQVAMKDIVIQSNAYQLSFKPNQYITDADIITMSYAGTTIQSVDATFLQPFTDLSIKNNLPVHVAIPATLQAENYTVNNGMSAETCTDTNGGLDMGYTDVNDYLDYNVRPNKTGSYGIEVRYACNGSTDGIMQVQQLNDTIDTVLNSVNISLPLTGGWQTWNSALAKMNLTVGASRLRFKIVQSQYNLNWYRFTPNVVNAVEPNDGFSLYPNPASKAVTLQMPQQLTTADKKMTIYNSFGQVVKSPNIESNSQNSITVPLDGLTPGLYVLVLQSENRSWRFKMIVE